MKRPMTPLTLNESVPAGTVEAPEDVAALRRLIAQADALRGSKQDPKLKALIDEVQTAHFGGLQASCVSAATSPRPITPVRS